MYNSSTEVLISLATIIATGLVTFYSTKKKYKAEVASNELENVEQAITIWKNLAMDLRHEVSLLKDEVTALKEQLKHYQHG